MLLFAACLVLAVVGYYLQVSLLQLVVLLFMALVGVAVGLSWEVLRLDFHTRRLQYQRRFLGWRMADVNDDFSRVQAVLLYDNSVDTSTPGEVNVQSAWNVVLKYVGDPPLGILVGIFVDRAAAVQEAEFLAGKLGVPTESRR